MFIGLVTVDFETSVSYAGVPANSIMKKMRDHASTPDAAQLANALGMGDAP